MEEGRLRRVGHDLDAVDLREGRGERAGVVGVDGDPVEPLVERDLGRDDEGVQRDEVPALAPLPDARLCDQRGVAGERGTGDPAEPL